jgi:hypothetical protein
MKLPRRVLTPEFIEAWRAYQAANARAADAYAARMAAPEPGVRPKWRDCPRCRRKTRASTRTCRACVQQEREER